VKVKPYKYPLIQKQQIESIVHDMLNRGSIVPSTSHFSSPIILVKKKNDTWTITVKDSFPIPMVYELINELFGAKYLSKLGLR